MTTASERLGGARGFTLVELMLAVAILGMVLVMLAGSFHAVASGKVQAENRLAVDQTARAILAQIADEIRGAVSTWYAVYLDVPTPTRVFVAPIAMIALSAGLGMLLVTRAQRRERVGDGRRPNDSSHTEER